MSFCSLPCFQAHVPILRHRDAWAEEKRAPSYEQWASETDGGGSPSPAAEPKPPAVSKPQSSDTGLSPSALVSPADRPSEAQLAEISPEIAADILIVVSKLKQYVRARSGMNTSDGIMKPLSSIVRRFTDQAIHSAARDGRKTVLDRDFSEDNLLIKR